MNVPQFFERPRPRISTTSNALNVRESALLEIPKYYDGEAMYDAAARAEQLSDAKLAGWIKLMETGEHPETSYLLIRRVPDALVPECVLQIQRAQNERELYT